MVLWTELLLGRYLIKNVYQASSERESERTRKTNIDRRQVSYETFGEGYRLLLLPSNTRRFTIRLHVLHQSVLKKDEFAFFFFVFERLLTSDVDAKEMECKFRWSSSSSSIARATELISSSRKNKPSTFCLSWANFSASWSSSSSSSRFLRGVTWVCSSVIFNERNLFAMRMFNTGERKKGSCWSGRGEFSTLEKITVHSHTPIPTDSSPVRLLWSAIEYYSCDLTSSEWLLIFSRISRSICLMLI